MEPFGCVSDFFSLPLVDQSKKFLQALRNNIKNYTLFILEAVQRNGRDRVWLKSYFHLYL